MRSGGSFAVHPGWAVLLKDVGIDATSVLRRAALPDDLFSRPSASLSTLDYFRFWQALEEEADDPALPIRLGSGISVEAFDAPIFAALCSPNLNTALQRIRRYKPLIGPMALHIDQGSTATTLEIEFLEKAIPPPPVLIATELVFFVELARLATREGIRPAAVETPAPPRPAEAFTSYFGNRVRTGPKHAVTFSALDAARPFLTRNDAMWLFFRPELRKRLAELDETATVSDRVRGALLELLPSGRSALGAVANRLAVSTRTLQRRLSAEGSSFQEVLDSTREALARHYLGNSTMSGGQIAFLLGYEDPNSFFRAFHAWTGETPEQVRLVTSRDS